MSLLCENMPPHKFKTVWPWNFEPSTVKNKTVKTVQIRLRGLDSIEQINKIGLEFDRFEEDWTWMDWTTLDKTQQDRQGQNWIGLGWLDWPDWPSWPDWPDWADWLDRLDLPKKYYSKEQFYRNGRRQQQQNKSACKKATLRRSGAALKIRILRLAQPKEKCGFQVSKIHIKVVVLCEGGMLDFSFWLVKQSLSGHFQHCFSHMNMFS